MSASSSPFPLTLDDAASLVLQIEATDRDGLKQVHALLAGAQAVDPETAATLIKVVRQLKYAIDFPSDAPTALGFVNEILAEAMEINAHAELGRQDTPQDTPRPVVETLPVDTELDLLQDFIAETRDDLQRTESALLTLEHNPSDEEAINQVFRAFHSIKGTSAFLGLTHINNFAHQAESLLSAVRDHTIPFTKTCADLALRASDMLKSLIGIAQRATPGGPLVAPEGYDALLHTLAAVEANGGVDVVPASGPAEDSAVSTSPALEIPLDTPTPTAARDTVSPASSPTSASHVTQSADTSIRVRTERLDKLIDMVGELVIAQAMLSQDPTVTSSEFQDLSRKVAHAGKIVRELQDLSMSMRMVPLRATFQKMLRLSRDTAHKSGKIVELVLEGEDTEIDRNMVDVISDPLVHMIRNAVDHGIELPHVRVSRGKPEIGTLRLTAYHAGGAIIVELQDDGNGLDRDRIAQKAIERGLIESDKGMSDADIYKLIFAPGFSTNDVVTSLSGRGVGMDVVKRNIESLQGRLDISSEPGRGTKFTIRLPLTLAITDGMCVRVGTERYIIPTIHIQLSFRPTQEMLFTVAGRGEMVLLRDDLMPLVRLHHIFGTEDAVQDPTNALLVVANAGDERIALLVDELLGQQQVVAKPLGDGIGRIAGVSGGAILGDGRVGLILEVPELALLARSESSRIRPAA